MNKHCRVKFCGMRSVEDVKAAQDCGVDAVGFILYPKSKRYIDSSQLQMMSKALSAFVQPILVVVNSSTKDVKEALSFVPHAVLQFHGDESVQFCKQFDRPYIKAIAADTTASILQGMRTFSDATAILVDTPSKQYGGTGDIFDWSRVPRSVDKNIILAGGLNEHNISKAIQAVRPYAVDICSGIEDKDGRKSMSKMIAVMNRIKAGV